MSRKRRQVGGEIVNAAVQEGVGAILQQHPRFRGREEYILGHIDRRELTKKINEIVGKEDYRGSPEEQKKIILYKDIANYVASGKLLDDAGKEVILRGSLEEKAKSFWHFSARRQLKGEKYLDDVMGAFSDLYSLLKSGDYATRMPELAEAVTTVYDMGFLDSAVDILSHYKLINNRKYNMLKKNIRKKTKEAGERVGKGIEEHVTAQYATAQRVAASVLAVLGLGVLVSTAKITANVIGITPLKDVIGIPIGIALIIFSCILLWKKKH